MRSKRSKIHVYSLGYVPAELHRHGKHFIINNVFSFISIMIDRTLGHYIKRSKFHLRKEEFGSIYKPASEYT